MSDEERKALIHWIAEGQDDFAAQLRAIFHDTVAQFQTFVVDFGKLDRRRIMRKKIRRCYR
jgi:hypothetical protein